MPHHSTACASQLVVSCTTLLCHMTRVLLVTAMPEDCTKWFDGCNICTRRVPGAPVSCTLKHCEYRDEQEPTCLETGHLPGLHLA